MHLAIIGIFIITALLGVFLITRLFMNKPMPSHVATIHGICAGIGILALIFYAMNHTWVLPSLILFIFAALGGIYMLITHLTGKNVQKAVALAHGGTATVALILLLLYVYHVF